MAAASEAFPAWRATPTAERARLVRRVGEIMEQRVYEIAAALALEVGKNRMEALGEAQETVDFFNHYADDFESHGGFDHELPNDPRFARTVEAALDRLFLNGTRATVEQILQNAG